MKKILILGGTRFIGRNLVEQLQNDNNYEITLFNRQQTHSQLFPDIRKIKGDRETADIKKIAGQYWDYIIDLSGYYPDSLAILLNEIKGQVGRYIFISTLSAYQLEEAVLKTYIHEGMATLPCEEWQRTDKTITTYGQRKAACERVLLQAEWLDKIILRPSVVYGKYDPTDRFYYWLYRSRHQQPFLLPGDGTDRITLTYVADLIHIIMLAMKIKSHAIVYNAATHAPLSLQEIILYMHKGAPGVAVSAAQLIASGIRPEEDIPLWFNTPLMLSNERLAKDFCPALKSFDESVAATTAYYSTLNWPEPATGIDLKREKVLIEKYR